LENASETTVSYDAAQLLAAQSALREEFDGWERDATDESKPLVARQTALNSLAEHAKRVSEVEQKAWGTVRHQLIDEESAKVLRRLATTADRAEMRAQAIETLGQLKDIDGMDAVLAGLEDESLEVRQAAHGALRNILSTDFGFRADDPPAQRAAAVAQTRKFWGTCSAHARFVEGIRNPALLKRWKQAAQWRDKPKPGWERESPGDR
jgi:ABC-type transporter Mla subunit MlaD